MEMVGGVELGGTKTRVARGTADGRIDHSDTFPTEAPGDTFARIVDFFSAGAPIAALGVGAFGPLSINARDADYGRLRATPKPGWRDFDIGAALSPLGVPFVLDTDVNAAGLGEARAGALRGVDCGVYLTVGTGIGGALMIGGKPVHGGAHPEMGHIGLIRQPGDDAPSFCPFHPDCAEGLTAGPAIERRFGASLNGLDLAHPAHELVADYLGQLAMALLLFASVERIVIGGGVAKASGLHTRAHMAMLTHLNGYGVGDAAHHDGFLVPPALGDDAGLTGALMLAGQA